MKEILFRGKRVDNGEWIYGVAFPHDNAQCTMFHQHPMDGSLVGKEVVLKTVGQYTGVIDKNGTRIFEDDLVKCGKYVLLVDWEECTGYHPFNGYGCTPEECEVIGNIHDNPELLEGE